MMGMENLPQAQDVQRMIFMIRGRRVMLDSDLADLYAVPTMQFNRQVRRNARRFPEDFMFTLTAEEFKSLICQIGISKKGRGGRRKLPMVFTQEGVAMLSSVLHSDRAIDVNVAIMRAFVKLRELLLMNKDLAQKLADLELQIQEHGAKIRGIFGVLKKLMNRPRKAPPKIGFLAR